jgi:hypothetical protein
LLAWNGAGPAPCVHRGEAGIDLSAWRHRLSSRSNANVQATRLAESDDRYPAVAILNQRYRVIRCRDGIQWILQRRNIPAGTGGNRPERHSRDDWRGRSYCRTREALIRCCRAYSGEIDPAAVVALRTLPERIDG